MLVIYVLLCSPCPLVVEAEYVTLNVMTRVLLDLGGVNDEKEEYRGLGVYGHLISRRKRFVCFLKGGGLFCVVSCS